MPSAPLGGRLREADTRPCLVVSPVFVACRQKSTQNLSDLGLAEGASHECAETRAFRASGARSRGQFRRAIAPDRGPFRPRAAPKSDACVLVTLCYTETLIIAHCVLILSLTSDCVQHAQRPSVHFVYNLVLCAHPNPFQINNLAPT